MDKIALFSQVKTARFLRKYGAPLIILIACTGVITFGVHALVHWTIDTAIKKHAEMDAMTWAKEFNAQVPETGALLTDGSLTKDQQEVIDAAIDYGSTYAFILYGTDGRAIYSSDYGVFDAAVDHPINPIAYSVVTSGLPSVEAIRKTNPNGTQSVFVDALMLLQNKNGEVIGVAQLYLDKSETAAVYTHFLNWVDLLLPLLCALIYILPSLAFIMKREQVFAGTERVDHLSRFDTLTGALNRHTMSTECKARFADRDVNKTIGVFFLDVDKFKNINDTNGHEFGDAYLKHITSILINNVRRTDLVGRMGGDEFVIAFPDATQEILDTIGERILTDARQPFEYKGKTIQSGVSIGSHLAGLEETGPEALHAADLALYHAKSNGRNRMQRYFRELDIAMVRRCKVEARMRNAIRDGEFETYFQPLTRPDDRSIVGFEALLRLNNEEGDPISPNEFIPIAEETGMIHILGMQTLRQAINAAKSWPDHIFLSANLSPAQFEKGDLVAEIQALLTEVDFPASRLELEVTESLLMADEERVSAQLVGLKRLGVSIAMDDFGTGYSSLGYLWKYDFDKLKIDRVFLEGFEFDSARYRGIIETIITLGHKMDMQVTVEGVETEMQTQMLEEFSCDQYQGFLFGRPMPADQALEAILADHARKTSVA